jgi:acyl CoA:acetate/3-ketoacid CoA transferase
MADNRRTYTRDDGVEMVEVAPGVFVSREWAERMGLLR